VLDLVGNVWQWTDEWEDDHTRAAIPRGGSHYQPQGARWYFPQAYRLSQHGKYLLMAPDGSLGRGGVPLRDGCGLIRGGWAYAAIRSRQDPTVSSWFAANARKTSGAFWQEGSAGRRTHV
jgi:hypothetical protein